MRFLTEVVNKPLARLLGGVNTEVFGKAPETIGLRDLQHDLSSVLQKLRVNQEYRVLTNRGAPSFLLIPLDPWAWSSLLTASPPEMEYELEKAHRLEREGEPLPDTETVLRSADTQSVGA